MAPVGGLALWRNWYRPFVGAGYSAAWAFAPLRIAVVAGVENSSPFVAVGGGGHPLPWRCPSLRVALWLFGVSVAIALLTAVLYVPGDIDSACSATSHHGYWYVFGRCISINDTLYLSTISRAGGLMMGAGLRDGGGA